MKASECTKDSVEIWAKNLDTNKKIVPLTKEQNKEFSVILFHNKQIDNDQKLLKNVEEKKMGIASLIYLRAKYYHTFNLSMSVVMLLGVVCKTPGDVVIYLNYLQYKCFTLKIKEVTIREFCETLFPMGFLDEETLHTAWTSQKIDDNQFPKSDNMLDYPACQESIRDIYWLWNKRIHKDSNDEDDDWGR